MKKNNITSLSRNQNSFSLNKQFLVLLTEKKPLFELSPEMMTFEDFTIFNMQATSLYFEKNLFPINIEKFDQVIKKTYGTSSTAIFSTSVFKAVLFALFCKNRKIKGTYCLRSQLSQNQYKSISWEEFFSLGEKIQTNFFPSLLKSYQFQKKLKKFVYSMSINNPSQFPTKNEDLLKKRYGNFWGGFLSEILQKAAKMIFPWVNTALKKLPSTYRFLEFPVSDWNTISYILKEDFKKISSSQKVLSIKWTLTLINFKKIDILINFRYPFSINSDAPDYNILLAQFSYSFQHFLLNLKSRKEDLDLPETIPLVSWKVEIAQALCIPEETLSLFENSKKKQEIFSLENRLSLPLKQYQNLPHHTIGNDYEETRERKKFSSHQVFRPLFLHSSPQKHISLTSTAFIERVSTPWWEDQDPENFYQDFHLIHVKNKYLWASLDSRGIWKEYGQFD